MFGHALHEPLWGVFLLTVQLMLTFTGSSNGLNVCEVSLVQYNQFYKHTYRNNTCNFQRDGICKFYHGISDIYTIICIFLT